MLYQNDLIQKGGVMRFINPILISSILLFVAGCDSASTSASEHSFKGKRYVIVGTTKTGFDSLGLADVSHKDTVLTRNADGTWGEVGDSYLAEQITSEGKFIRRLDSTKIKTTPYGGALIPNAELNKTSASDIQGD